jgi:hypothetical protein
LGIDKNKNSKQQKIKNIAVKVLKLKFGITRVNTNWPRIGTCCWHLSPLLINRTTIPIKLALHSEKTCLT